MKQIILNLWQFLMWDWLVIPSSNLACSCWPTKSVCSFYPPIPHHWFVNIFYTTAYEFVRVIRTRIQIAVTCNCCLIWLHNTLKFPSCTAYCTFTWCQFELGPKRTTTLPPHPPITLNIPVTPICTDVCCCVCVDTPVHGIYSLDGIR